VLPCWLSVYLPQYEQVFSISDFKENSYVAESGFGYPSIKRILREKLEIFAECNIYPDCIVVIYDVDDWNENEKRAEQSAFDNIFIASGLDIDYRLMPISKCFETWLLGNRNIYPEITNDDFKVYEDFYNVYQKDPENMLCPKKYGNSVSVYHYEYLQSMLKISTGKKYTKGRPWVVANGDYLRGIMQRVDTTTDLESFRVFISFLGHVRYSSNF
jgi:hypothetical protein